MSDRIDAGPSGLRRWVHGTWRRAVASQFARHSVTLLVGTLVSQVVLLGAAPVLSRLCRPSEFGILAAFMAIAGFTQVFATGRYEIAILLPSDDDDARDLVNLVFIVTGGVSA